MRATVFTPLVLLVVFLSFTACQEEEKKVLVRVYNDSGYDFTNVTLQESEKKVFYGDLPKGEITYYQFFTSVSEVPNLDFAIDGKRVKPTPELEKHPAQSLPTGNFSYKVSIEETQNGSFYEIEVEDDVHREEKHRTMFDLTGD